MRKFFVNLIVLMFLMNIFACTSIYHHVKNKRNRNYKEGIALYKKRNYKEANDRFETVVSIEPGYKRAKYYYKKTSRYLKRKEHYKKNREIRKQRKISRLYRKGLKLKKRRRYSAALDVFLRVYNKDPDYEDTVFNIDDCRDRLAEKYKRVVKKAKKQYKKRKYIDARRTSITALKYNPDGSDASNLLKKIDKKLNRKSRRYRKRAERLFKRKKYEKAMASVEKALGKNPWDEKAKELKPKIKEKIKIEEDYRSAVKTYKRKIYFASYKKFKNINKRVGKYKKTERYIKKLKKKLKRVSYKYYKKGIAYYDKGDYKKALKYFNMVLVLNPGHSKAKVYKKRSKAKMELKKSMGK